MGKRRCRARQPSMWVASTDLPRSAGHPFYHRLNRVLDEAGFDAFVEEQCATFYADGVGRPSLAPGRYVRMLLLGYVEGLDSERAMAWRAADSLSVRQFLDVALHEAPPDHSTVSRTRRRIDVETHLAVFTWGTATAGRRGPGHGHDGRHRRDDAGSQCGVAAASFAGTRERGTSRFCVGWPRRRAWRRRSAPSWPASTARVRRRGPTTIGRIRRTRTRRSRR